jgi:cytoplasmic iron level regulating protein YaaA (DUF328/UPF0246 family)
LEEAEGKVLINLASNDYAKSVDQRHPGFTWIDISFLDKKKNGSYAEVGILSKKARGMMVKAICHNRWRHPEALQQFSHGYAFSPEDSTPHHLVFKAN